ncbi:protocatechuate 3,4-dioxygenase subunit alpha [Tsukamurella spumae]|uniref:Protocatechuate 3,4-dioxygenase subunit alpha n=1 Tax=Tsukamurella spumae TaxID=44753 RepID=A0A846WXE6_9ACTN|nr:protocatechuate 3,4-dioxygenase subunit alpha [Tsukamurella spumae]NKY17828.1 protocatechuate 3,4-dioxygenase subunit alpha [Tsukamurella spumae]
MIDSGSNTDAPRYPVFSRAQDEVPVGLMPSQTVGPYVHIGLLAGWEKGWDAVPDGATGTVDLELIAYDGAGQAIADAMFETWQADAAGGLGSSDPRGDAPSDPPGFRHLARVFADDDGVATIRTVKPGALPGEAPHINLGLFARGILERLMTRIYFPEDTAAQATDPVLTLVPETDRHRLIAERTATGYRFEIHVQDTGSGETPFFAL